jgi:acyl-CoA synthetase (AMP-forming)/AMP-acid ligase II
MLSAYWPEGTARYGHVPLKRSTQVCVHEPAQAGADRVALAVGDERVCYGELSERTARAATALRARLERGSRLALALDDPGDLLVCTLGALEADLLAWPCPAVPDAGSLARFAPDLIVTAASVPGLAAEVPRVDPAALLEGEAEPCEERPRVREPALALGHPVAGEVLHSHRTLLATAISWSSFFCLEPGAEVLLLEPPSHWLGLAALLGTWKEAGTVHVAWRAGDALPAQRFDYAVVGLRSAEDRWLRPGSRPHGAPLGVGAIVGIEAGLPRARRRRLASRLRTSVLSVFGRNDLGPVLASHPSWFLDDAAGIPLPNVDVRPLDPADGRELAIGWDAVEEAEMGIKSALSPAGGEQVGNWLRSHEIAHVDPTGSYFLRPAPRRG